MQFDTNPSRRYGVLSRACNLTAAIISVGSCANLFFRDLDTVTLSFFLLATIIAVILTLAGISLSHREDAYETIPEIGTNISGGAVTEELRVDMIHQYYMY